MLNRVEIVTKKKTKFRSSILLAFAFLAIVCYFFISFFNLRAQVAEKTAEVNSLKKQVTEQQKENEKREDLLAKGDFDAFVEQRARDEDLGYVYPDERVYYDMSAAGQ